MRTGPPPAGTPDIRRFALFSDLDRDAVTDVTSGAHRRSVRRGRSAFEQGQPADTIYLVLSGRFKALQVGSDGSQIVTRLAGAGDLMGHISAFK